MDYILKRSNRKTIGLHITKDAQLEVRAPKQASAAYIERFIRENRKWVEEHQHKMQTVKDTRESFQLNYGHHLLLCGKEYEIVGRDEHFAGFDNCFYMPKNLPLCEIRTVVIRTYKAMAKKILTEKLHHFAEKVGVTPKGLRITSAKTRWGSCSGRNSISFSWFLVMAPHEVIDYVVIHELCHIVHHNHSANFWSLVSKHVPDYAQRKKQLKKLQERLSNENWD